MCKTQTRCHVNVLVANRNGFAIAIANAEVTTTLEFILQSYPRLSLRMSDTRPHMVDLVTL